MSVNNKAASPHMGCHPGKETSSHMKPDNSTSPVKHQDQTSMPNQVRALLKADNNSTTSQKLLELRHIQLVGSATTLQFRHLLDVMYPPQVLKPRKAGYLLDCQGIGETN